MIKLIDSKYIVDDRRMNGYPSVSLSLFVDDVMVSGWKEEEGKVFIKTDWSYGVLSSESNIPGFTSKNYLTYEIDALNFDRIDSISQDILKHSVHVLSELHKNTSASIFWKVPFQVSIDYQNDVVTKMSVFLRHL